MNTSEKLTTIAENVPKVYEAGQKSEYDRFWDAYQDNGNRLDYNLAFGGNGWNSDNFKPKYDIKPISCYEMFRTNKANIDLVERLEELGITLDISKATGSSIFYGCAFTRVGVLDFTNYKDLTYTFYISEFLEEISELILKSDGSQMFNFAFTNCKSLKHIKISGLIGEDINFQSCPLTTDSMISIITHLKPYYDDEEKKNTRTITFSEECWTALAERDSECPAFEGTGYGWREMVEYDYFWNT